MVKVSIIGATGYAGAELVKLLLQHPEVTITHVTSESNPGVPLCEVYPHLRGVTDLVLESAADIVPIAKDSDFLFVGLPHGHAMKIGLAVKDLPVRIIDLGADYRFDDVNTYEAWYHVPHTYPDAPRVYGLAELTRDQVKDAKIIGNAGCYTTASILALAPLVEAGLIDTDSIVIDAKSGVSGAGRKAAINTSFCEVSLSPYGTFNHRHQPEISHHLGKEVLFQPHLGNYVRGILATIYVQLAEGVTPTQVDQAYLKAYEGKPLVRLTGQMPSIRGVASTPYCDIAWQQQGNMLVVVSAIDNLLKGAASQAMQCINIKFGFEPATGLI